MMKVISVIIAALFTENFVMVKFLGICPFLGVSKKTETAVGMGLAVTFVMAISSACTWAVNELLLVRLGLEYLQTVVFILIIAGLVQLVEMFVKKTLPALYGALGIYLPLITTNCAVLGVALLNVQNGYGFMMSIIYATFAALGFSMAIVLFSGIRERIDEREVPESFRGFPIALVSAGLMAIAFSGFAGFAI